MVLSDKKIRELARKESLIENFIEDNLQASSYDVTISNHIMRFSDYREPIHLFDKDAIDKLLYPYNIDGGYLLKPNEYVLTILNEKFNLPSNICAHIKPRTSLVRLGILTTSQFLNPTYSGILNIGIYNASQCTYVLTPNLAIAQFMFEELTDEPSTSKLYKNKVDAKFQNEDGHFGSKIYTDKELTAYAEFERRYKTNE